MALFGCLDLVLRMAGSVKTNCVFWGGDMIANKRLCSKSLQEPAPAILRATIERFFWECSPILFGQATATLSAMKIYTGVDLAFPQLGARLRGRMATQRSKKGSEKGSGERRVLRRGLAVGFTLKKGSQKGSQKGF